MARIVCLHFSHLIYLGTLIWQVQYCGCVVSSILILYLKYGSLLYHWSFYIPRWDVIPWTHEKVPCCVLMQVIYGTLVFNLPSLFFQIKQLKWHQQQPRMLIHQPSQSKQLSTLRTVLIYIWFIKMLNLVQDIL